MNITWSYVGDSGGVPFSTPTLWILDIFRILVVVLGSMVVIMTPFALIRLKHVWSQMMRISALAMFILSTVITEFEHFGYDLHWRLPFNCIAVVLALWGMYALFMYEQPVEVRASTRIKRRRRVN